MKQFKNRHAKFNSVILFVNCLFAFALLISYLAPIIDPQFFWPVAFFGLGYLWLLVGNILFIVYWLLFHKAYALISFLCAIIGAKLFITTVGFHKTDTDLIKHSPKYIRVMTYNVHDFNIGFPNEAQTKPLMLRLINEEQPDVIGFEEYYSWRKQNTYQICDSLKKILHTNYYYFEPFGSTTTYDIGLAIYSKLPIIAHGLIGDGGNKNDSPGIFVDVRSNNNIYRIYCLHLESLQFEPRDYKYVDNLERYKLSSLSPSLHVISKLKAAYIRRSEQVSIVKEQAKKCPYPYIFFGDFNDIPISYAVNQMKAGLKNAFDEKGHGFSKTFNGNIPNFQIDYIMASQQFDVINYKVIEQKLSDHYPVRSDLLLK